MDIVLFAVALLVVIGACALVLRRRRRSDDDDDSGGRPGGRADVHAGNSNWTGGGATGRWHTWSGGG